MRKLMVSTLLFTASTLSSLNTLPADEFDFWVGHWEVTWDEGNGKTGRGTNHIIKVIDEKVIQEDFRIIEGQSKGYKGRSLSVYNPKNQTWKQSWVDNQGGHYDFTGDRDLEGNPIFITSPLKKGDKILIQRMVFRNITNNSFIWDWESSEDDGKTWKLNWRINYKLIRLGKQQMESSSGLYDKAHPSAPDHIGDFDTMMGTCKCKSQRIGTDGSWQDTVDLKWTFKYIMDGMGVQDEFSMADGQSGGSIRQYNPDSSQWYVHYYSSNAPTPQLNSWEGSKTADNNIVLYSPAPGRDGTKGFTKLTFYNMSKQGYQWKGEWVNEDESIISPFWKIDCLRN